MNCALLISGGVDSSVALKLLQQQGFQVTAFYLKIWLEDELAFLGECPWEDDLGHVRLVCEQAQVNLRIIPLQKDYWQEVVTYVLQSVQKGLTPNPDLLCNQKIKFGAFYRTIQEENFDYIATGHYAQRTFSEYDDFVQLLCSPDAIKDQTYFLALLDQKQLSRLIFPVGHLMKSEVRLLAEQFDLPNKKRKDSQGICFLGKIKFHDFVMYHVGKREGNLVEYETGKILGHHDGFWFYTIGQRQGIGLSGGPWYVVAKNIQENVVFISREYTEEKRKNSCMITSCNWIAEPPSQSFIAEVKLRHGPLRYQAYVNYIDGMMWDIRLIEKKDQGIAAGQYAVFYNKNRCLGGGVIIT